MMNNSTKDMPNVDPKVEIDVKKNKGIYQFVQFYFFTEMIQNPIVISRKSPSRYHQHPVGARSPSKLKYGKIVH